MNNVAPGHLKGIRAGHGNVVVPAGWAGVKSPYQRILQWTGSGFADKGWVGGGLDLLWRRRPDVHQLDPAAGKQTVT